MGKVINNFLNKVHPRGREGASFTDIIAYLVHLDLKRCLDVNHKLGTYTFCCFRQSVFGFLLARSEGISNDLINGVHKPVILMGIDGYKFKKLDVNKGSKDAAKRRREKKINKSTLKVAARSLSGNSEWSAVS